MFYQIFETVYKHSNISKTDNIFKSLPPNSPARTIYNIFTIKASVTTGLGIRLQRNLLNVDETLRIPSTKSLINLHENKSLLLNKVMYKKHPLSKKLKEYIILNGLKMALLMFQ